MMTKEEDSNLDEHDVLHMEVSLGEDFYILLEDLAYGHEVYPRHTKKLFRIKFQTTTMMKEYKMV